MNFQLISPLEGSKNLLDLAFRKAREKSEQKKFIGEWLDRNKRKEARKLDIIKDVLVSSLEKILRNFPSSKDLPKFYIKLMNLTLDFPEFKRSLGAVNWAAKRVRLLHKDYARKIGRTTDGKRIPQLSKEFYGRISSTIKQINPNLEYLEQCRKIMKMYPDIKEMFTVCIYGFPNVGKTTLLNNLTTAKGKVAEYPFTTTGINVGYLNINGSKIQVLDVPGTLARKEKMSNIELQAELVANELADLIVFVFDLSGYCGYPVEKQEQLLQKLGQRDNLLVYLSKTDLPEGKPTPEFKHKYYSAEELKLKILEKALKTGYGT
ncbi:MAG: GTPase [Nanoarchaeota archaeon]